MIPLPSARLVGDDDPVDFRMRKLESAGRGVVLDGDCDLDETLESLPLLGGDGDGSSFTGKAGATVAGESDGGLTLVVSRGGTGAGGARFKRLGLKICPDRRRALLGLLDHCRSSLLVRICGGGIGMLGGGPERLELLFDGRGVGSGVEVAVLDVEADEDAIAVLELDVDVEKTAGE